MKTPFRSIASRIGLGLIAVTLASCAGAKFNRDWDAAVAAHQSGETAKSPVEGPWTGTWLSHVNGHNGDLRCLVTPAEDGADSTYDFRYHATWGSFFQGGFTPQFTVKPDGKRGLRVKGEEDLGIFGSFQHDGWIKGDTFEATYASDMGDHGVFELARPE